MAGVFGGVSACDRRRVREKYRHVVLRGVVVVTVGLAPRQADLMKVTAGFAEGRVTEDSIWAVLHCELPCAVP